MTHISVVITKVCLFRLEMISRNHFTLACVFGNYRKLGQTEIKFPVDCKTSLIRCKTILAFILPLNYFQTWKIEEIEKEQEEIAPAPNSRSHHRPQPQITPVLSYPNTDEIAPLDPPMPDLSLSQSTSPFPSIVDHSLFLLLSI